MSRKEIAKRTGLTPAAITSQVGDLMAEGIVCEMYEQLSERRAGRREIILDISRTSYACVGIALSAYDSRACVMDFQGKLLEEHKLDFTSCGSSVELENHICSEVAGLELFCERQGLFLVGVGVSLRGIVNDRDGIWVDPYRYIPEKNVPLQAHLEERLSRRVTIEDNVRAMASAELLLSGYAPAEGVLFLKYGPGLGGAFCIGSDIYCGAHFQAAELGRLLMWDPNGNQPAVRLEDVVSYHAIEAQVRERYSQEYCPVLYQKTGGSPAHATIAVIFDAYAERDPGVMRILQRCQQNLLYAIRDAISLFDPRKVVLYGDAFENNSFYSDLMQMLHSADEFSDYHDSIAKSQFNTGLAVRGAAALALRTFLGAAD